MNKRMRRAMGVVILGFSLMIAAAPGMIMFLLETFDKFKEAPFEAISDCFAFLIVTGFFLYIPWCIFSGAGQFYLHERKIYLAQKKMKKMAELKRRGERELAKRRSTRRL